MEASPTLVINYFSGFKQSIVPLFQRPYTWDTKHWRTLWEDIESFYEPHEGQPKAVHFMGAIVTMPAVSVPVGVLKFLIIDGQQRLTTIALLMCAIRDVLPAASENLKRKIQDFYLTNYGYSGLDFFKLLPTQGDREYYSPIVQSLATPFPDSRFKRAYDFFRRRLRDQIDQSVSIDPARILDIIETKLMAVMINLSDSDDPYLIFESLNFKGFPLEQADLVRNYFLMRFVVSEQQAVYDNLWLPMQNRLGPNLTEFMRHFLGAEGEDVRRGDVYASIRRLVANSEAPAVKLLMTRLEKLSVAYSRIIGSSPEPNIQFKRYFESFRRLDFGTAYPLLLTMYEDYEEGQFAEVEFLAVLRILFSFVIRRMVASVPSNSLARFFVGLCKSKPVTDSPSTWLSGILCAETTNRRWPNDDEFSNAWVHAKLYLSRACSIVLEALEAHFEHHEAVQLDQISIEHVMPQTLNADWELMLGPNASAIHTNWLHTIGNLTLTGYNPTLSNDPYEEKCKVYANSHFELNRYFADYEVWNGTTIESRAGTLFKFASQIWSRPPETDLGSKTTVKKTSAAFYPECIRLAEDHLKTKLSKLSQTRYEAGTNHVRVVCAVSAEHEDASKIPYYWFGFNKSYVDFLSDPQLSFVCLGCGSPQATLLLPLPLIQANLKSMSTTKDENPIEIYQWHIVIQRRADRFIMRLLGGVDGPDLTEHLLKQPAKVS
ncbi:MAG: DUF262 domain-containing protein [Terracidiphilus sp.]|jgi:uncharacterized protein with ParB-like and HNH nuclease domain